MIPKKVIAFGECMLEVQANGFGPAAFSYGGDTFNTAIYLRRCSQPKDIQVGYATGLGVDPLSQKLMKAWQHHGLELSCVRQMEGKLPGMYLIETDEAGERFFHFWRENSAARSYFDALLTPLEQQASSIDCLYFSGISLAILDPGALQRFFAMVTEMRNSGKQVVFDNNYRSRLWSSNAAAREVFQQALLLASTALITADDHQAVFELKTLDEAVQHAQRLEVSEIVIKRGAQPTLAKSNEMSEWASVNTQHVSTVVDTTAAGDSFAAGYLSRRLNGMSPQEAADYGNRVAARVVQHRGAIIPGDAMRDLVQAN